MVGYTHHICGSNATPTAHAQFSSKLIQLQMASFSLSSITASLFFGRLALSFASVFFEIPRKLSHFRSPLPCQQLFL
uniref:Uncharacterized protein n=2 Tax=Amphimedon queenslandica TaxID=400682 RepID=A0A1X7SE81_AMPQE